MASRAYDLILVGSGFASTFFLHRALQKLGPDARILVLESGRRDTHAWQLQNRSNSSIPYQGYLRESFPAQTFGSTIQVLEVVLTAGGPVPLGCYLQTSNFAVVTVLGGIGL